MQAFITDVRDRIIKLVKSILEQNSLAADVTPAARLVDLDVYSPGGEAVDRASLLLQPRPCLCCGEPARDCLLEGAHPLDELTARARELLAGLDA